VSLNWVLFYLRQYFQYFHVGKIAFLTFTYMISLFLNFFKGQKKFISFLRDGNIDLESSYIILVGEMRHTIHMVIVYTIPVQSLITNNSVCSVQKATSQSKTGGVFVVICALLKSKSARLLLKIFEKVLFTSIHPDGHKVQLPQFWNRSNITAGQKYRKLKFDAGNKVIPSLCESSRCGSESLRHSSKPWSFCRDPKAASKR
jgi:hypothetical protein